MRTFLIIISVLLVLSSKAQTSNAMFDIPVFAYHRFGDDRYPSTNTSVKVFDSQLEYLKEHNFMVITVGEAVQLWKAGKDMPEKAAIITIDDGYLSFYKHGWPVLKKYGFPATVFIQTETVGGGDFMDWSQITEIKNAGMEIGNHSASHAYFLNFTEAQRLQEFESDLKNSSSDFKEHLGEVPTLYVYPYGEWTREMWPVLEELGFEAALVQQSGVFCESSSAWAIPRFPMGGPFGTVDGFINKSTMKALRVAGTTPQNPVPIKNPPQLNVELIPGEVQLENAQFFVGGDKTPVTEVSLDPELPRVILKANKKLNTRRTLYTLTAPSTDGKSWHWFSYLWIIPEIQE